MTFGGRRSRLKHPGSVGAWLWVAGAGNCCSVTLCGRRSTSVTFGGRRSRLKPLVALERGSGWLVQGMVRCSVTLRGRRSTIWWQAQWPLYNLVPRNISVQ